MREYDYVACEVGSLDGSVAMAYGLALSAVVNNVALDGLWYRFAIPGPWPATGVKIVIPDDIREKHEREQLSNCGRCPPVSY